MSLTPVGVFFSYSHKDEHFKEQLDTHLSILQRKGLINTWNDRKISPGQDWESIIEAQLDRADIVLFLISPDFVASDYCYGKEMLRALERHERNEAKVIPIIVRPVDWSDAPFSRLQVLPKDGKPVVSWAIQDQAWLDVEQGIRKSVEELQETKFRETSTATLTSIRDVLVAEFRYLEKVYGDAEARGIASDGIPTGLIDLDMLVGGLRASELIIIAGRPSVGKSDFVVNVLRAAAIGGGNPVAFFSLQMRAQRIIFRLLASMSEVDSQKTRIGYLGEKDFPRIAVAAGKLMDAPVFIDESPRLTIPEIKIRANSLKREKEVRLLIIDGLQQVVTQSPNDSAVALKALARELQMPVLATSNISPMADRRRDKRPLLADLEGNLQQESDVILFLYRDDLYESDPRDEDVLDLIVAKNRNGGTGMIRTQYKPAISLIRDFEEFHENPKQNTEP
jgi:replicative DNA helicase